MSKDPKGPAGLGFEEAQVEYVSASQNARILTETWAARWLYCANCGNDRLGRYDNNWPATDFYCTRCNETFELKSKKGPFGSKVVDGAFETLQERLSAGTTPNFAFLSYNAARREVTDLFLVPKQFVVPQLIEQRRPLPTTARRAGWIGCNIRLKALPSLGRVHLISNGSILPKNSVIANWRKSLFLKERSLEARGWLTEVMLCCEAIGREEFSLEDVYAHEARLSSAYPGNKNVRPKIRQQLQVLRDCGYLEFLGHGKYRLAR
jgi:type II restriction enzyme